MVQERFKLICASYLLLIKDNKILFGLRQNTGYMDGFYHLPAGHKEEGESNLTCLTREIKEELGIEIDSKKAKFVHGMHRRESDERVDWFFEVREYRGNIKNMEPEKCVELKWFDLNNLPENIVPYAKQAVENYKKAIYYSQFGWDD